MHFGPQKTLIQQIFKVTIPMVSLKKEENNQKQTIKKKKNQSANY